MFDEQELACKHCGAVILCGPPCCYLKVDELWKQAASEVAWLRKIQSKQTKRIQSVSKHLAHVLDFIDAYAPSTLIDDLDKYLRVRNVDK
jgi:hypothetical protein